MKRMSTKVSALTAAVVAATCLSAGAANAESPRLLASTECSNTSNGKLCVKLHQDPKRIQVWYDKNYGDDIIARLGVRAVGSATTWDPTWYRVKAGQTLSRTFPVNYNCNFDWKGLMQVDGQGTFDTPPATC